MAIQHVQTEAWRQAALAAQRDAVTDAQGRSSGGKTHDASSKASAADKGLWAQESFGFGDLIDVINPLQHIPVVSTVYRAITGDEIGAGARLVGGALFGGVAGLMASGIAAGIEHGTGKDIGEHALVAFTGQNTGNASSQEVSTAVAMPFSAHATRLSGSDPLPQPVVTTQSDAQKDSLEEADWLEDEEAAAIAQVLAPPSPPPPPATTPAKPLTPEEKAAALLEAQGLTPMLLKPQEHQTGDARAEFLLAGFENATRQYQQVQISDRLQHIAVGLGVKG